MLHHLVLIIPVRKGGSYPASSGDGVHELEKGIKSFYPFVSRTLSLSSTQASCIVITEQEFKLISKAI